MKHLFTLALSLVSAAALLASPAHAGTDEYMGDTNIYSGLPTTFSRPNVLIIVDNSRSTENTAGGLPFTPWTYADDGSATPNTYPLGFELDNNGNPTATACSSTTDNPGKGCFLPWNIYKADNQGDFSQRVIANSDQTLAGLTCDPSADSSKSIHKVLLEYGSYSGAASATFPTLASDGTCITSGNNNSGETYALGNFLNYTKSGGGSETATPMPDSVPEACSAEDPIIKACEWKNNAWNCGNNKYAYFQLKTTHTSSADPSYTPYTQQFGNGNNATDNPELAYWEALPTNPAPASYTQWDISTTYTTTNDLVVDGKTCAQHIADAGATPPAATGLLTQREIIHNALSQVITATAGVVNYGAMVYGGNNSGAQIIQSQYDSSLWTDMQDLSVGLTWDPDNPPDCSLAANAGLKVCKFIKALPGPGEADGAPRVSSNSNRPLAESVFDAGYYFGANYTPVTNTRRIPDAIKNPCDLNHIILLTNGFSNGDGSPKLDVIGDADNDGANEEVYGLGSHWLDDIAKHLNKYYGITTHTILAFQSEDALIKDAAVVDGQGQFYNVHSAEKLAAALRDLLNNIINDSSTSFVAPVVPASTTNRTISSNNVYLGLFRPQANGPWHGNIKKYQLSLSTYQLIGANGSAATDFDGSFYRDSVSFWSLDSSGVIPTATNDAGYIDPDNPDPNEPRGDGGEVAAGGTGGVLLNKMNALAAAIRSEGTWTPSGASWRNIYTYLDTTNSAVTTPSKNLYDAQNRFSTTNTNIVFSTTLDVLTPDKKDNLIRFTHGFVDDDDTTFAMTPATAEVRNWVLGDILHSRPLVFNYTKYTALQENTCYDSSSPTDPHNSSIIYVGANDGMLHAFRDCDGEEIWAFVPPDALSSLKYFKDPQSGHPTFVDAAPSLFVHDQNQDGVIDPTNDKVVLVFGQRRGGGTNTLDTTSSRGAFYALDVTVPLQPKFLWEVNNVDLGEIGETWSQPRLAKVRVDANNFKVVAFVGAGYDNNEDLRFGSTQTFPNAADDGTGNPVDINQASSGGTVDGTGLPLVSSGSLAADSRYAPRGRGVIAIEVASLSRTDGTSAYAATVSPDVSGSTVGQIYWSYKYSDNNLLQYSFPSDLTVLDLNGDSYADTVYAGDTGGNLWRFKVGAVDPASWNGTILFKSNPGSDSTNGRKIFYKPVIANIGVPYIYFGTGDREHPLNLSTTDRMYCVIDWGADGTYPVDESDLEDVTLNTMQKTDTSDADADAILSRLLSSPDAPYNISGDFTYGWFVKLDGGDRSVGGDPGEKVLAAATVFNGEVFFSTYQLKTGTPAGCDAGNLGISRLYQMNYRTGEATQNFDLSNDLSASDTYDSDGNALVNERSIGGENGEIQQRTDRVRTLGEGIPSGIVTLIDASGRVTQLISSSDKVEASGMTDIKLISPVYWMQW